MGVVIAEGDEVRAGLGRRVRRARLERVVLLGRPLLHRPVDLVGADVDDAPDLEAASGVHDDVGPEAVGVDEVVGPDDGAIDVALGSEVHHGVDSGHGHLQRARIADVALDEGVARVVVDILERGQVAGVGEGVVDDHLVVGLPQHVADVVGADEASSPRDEQLHGAPSSRSANRGAARSLADT